MVIKKPRDALKSVLKTSLSRNTQQKDKKPANLSSIRDPEARRITNDPALITATIKRLETKLLSPDKSIHPLETFPWLNAIPAGPSPNQHMIMGKITSAIFQEALHQLPNHKVFRPGNISGVLL
jgi:hypothetical protein